MKKLLKENVIYVLLFVIILGVMINLVFMSCKNFYDDSVRLSDVKASITTNEKRLEQIKQQKKEEEIRKSQKSEIKSGKTIYEVQGQQFSPEASFGIMFENVLSNMTNSGLRIRSIDYNYKPDNDKILMTNTYGYNSCELSFTAVGTYAQFQSFFKNLAKEKYLSSLYEVYIEPYDKNKTILITRFKVRLYTKTI